LHFLQIAPEKGPTMTKLTLIAGCALASIALSGCSTFGGLPGTSSTGANLAAIQGSLDKFNGAVAANCSGNLDVTQVLPMPPILGLHIQCAPHAAPVAP
jgi:hypothetical protein